MKTWQEKKNIAGFGVFVLVLMAGGCAIFWDIRSDVNENIRIAQQSHPIESDDVASLIAYVISGEHTLKERDNAVWTLGRIGDERAVSVLQPYYTGEKCYHVEELCQKELKKAIKRCEN